MSKEFGKYYLGLDIGTDSVGWAVTDLDYQLCKFNGKTMWGARLFDEANPAAERRGYRTARRRQQRKVQRIKLLQEIFSEEICKKDESFFVRMAESSYWKDDKTTNQANTLFNDDMFNDKEYHKLFPTIYHLRYALMQDGEYDIRLVYLALHHIIKNRGHFLFESDVSEIRNFENVFMELTQTLRDELGITLDITKASELEGALKNKSLGKKAKNDILYQIIGKSNPREKAVVLSLSGSSFTLSNLFNNKEYENFEDNKLSFSESKFDENYDRISELLQDKMYVLDKLKAVYDWALLSEILAGKDSLSEAKIAVYEKHKKDLAILKRVVRKYAPEKYKDIFSASKKENYAAYVGKKPNKTEILEKKCLQENVNAFIKKSYCKGIG